MRMFMAVVGCLAVAAVAAAPAGADSLAFIKDNNVWLSKSDGSGRYQVTFDGTPGAPYESPSQSDNGTAVAIRETPGQRRQIYRMTQSGGLLNPPINTPAPGTGAIDAKVSPDGALVAYWFATTVRDPICAFCVNATERALLSHADRFTGADELGTPNGGGRPSWLDNDTITLGAGSATQWYYTPGMLEEEAWFTDGLFTSSGLQTLLDAEVAPTGDRLAVVRGNNQETIRFLEMTGPPPDAPTPILGCWYKNPSGRFVSPTWTSDGGQLAWQEDDGVWLGDPGDFSCPLPEPELIIPGASEPDFSPAAINPGPRPGCGNPGNPGNPCRAQPPPSPPCGSCPEPRPGAVIVDPIVLRNSLGGFTKSVASAFSRLKIGRLLHKRQLTIVFTAPAAGTLTAELTASGASARRTTLIASGRRVYNAAGKAKLTIKLTPQGSKRLRKANRLHGTLKVSFAPQGSRAISTTRKVRLKR
jgi:hypothetical protein